MSTVGSRFAALDINVQDPYQVIQKKTKTKKSKAPLKESAVPKPQKSQKPKVEEKPNRTEEKPEPVATKKVTVVVTDTTAEVQSNERFPRKRDFNRAQRGAVGNKNPREETEAVVTSGNGQENNGPTVRDVRSDVPRTRFRRMIQNEGRVFDRRGAANSRVKPVEKKQGHGNFNWGDVRTAAEEAAEETGEESKGDGKNRKPQQTNATPGPEPEHLTLDQYREMLRDNKVDPLEWSNREANTNSAQTGDGHAQMDSDDFREYMYPKERDSSGRHGDRFSRGQRGRGRGRYRQGRNDRSTVRHEDSKRHQPKGAVVFDIAKDFPGL